MELRESAGTSVPAADTPRTCLLNFSRQASVDFALSHMNRKKLSRYWGSGFLPCNHQGVECRSPGRDFCFTDVSCEFVEKLLG